MPRNRTEYNRTWRQQNPERYKQNHLNSTLRTKYGLSLVEYRRLFEQQAGLCALCGNPETIFVSQGKLRKLAVDHCHTTGRVRGLLCGRCNTGLGKLGDTPEALRKALTYLER